MLYGRTSHFINGEVCTTGKAQPALRRLADTRRLTPTQMKPDAGAMELLYRWYRAGYIVLSESAG
jgi:hypothetical protein